MRLLFVHERMGAFGGAEANVLATAGELAARGHRLALAHGPGTQRGEDEWNRVFGSRFDLADPAALGRALGEFDPDVLYVHKLSDAATLARLGGCGRPVVRMVHDHDLYCMRGYKYRYFSRRICTRAASPFCIFPCGAALARAPGRRFPLRWVSYRGKRRELDLNRRFHRLIVASAYMREELLRNGFTADRIEIHPPVPRPAAPGGRPSFGPVNRIVYAGQIIRGKGVDVLLESLAQVRTPFECDILGDGSHREACEALSRRLGLDTRVRFAGFVPQSRVGEHYRDASLAVMSSLWPEPFGATGLEAMRCGLPVVAFDAGGIREWLRDGVNGFLVPWMDRAAFAARVDRLLSDKSEARRLGDNGRDLAQRRFSFESYIGGLESLFARTAAGNPASLPSQ